MEKYCMQCRETYDELSQLATCPHYEVRDSKARTRWEMGLRMLGNKVRMKDMPHGRPVGGRVLSLLFDGSLRIEGLPGEYSPELFDLEGDPVAVPVLGTVN